ncbi:unnamed protein product, partial [Ectocarpus sp. 12 AP-2014]
MDTGSMYTEGPTRHPQVLTLSPRSSIAISLTEERKTRQTTAPSPIGPPLATRDRNCVLLQVRCCCLVVALRPAATR